MLVKTQDGNRLNAQSFGDESAQAIIFCNSLGTDYRMWQPQIDALSSSYRVIAYDTRGHGQSSADGQGWTLDNLGQDVIAVLDSFGIDKAVFCGISMGGLTGQWLAINRADRFEHIVVCNTAAKIGNQQAWLERAELVRTQGMDPVADSAASRWFTAEYSEQNADKVNPLIETLRATSAEGYAKCCEVLAVADLRAELVSAKVPLTSIGGEFDPVTTIADAQWIAEQVAGAKLVSVPASHISNIEAEAQFTAAITAVLQQS
ncbi:MAG: 3-oxoadipate enol-lactonase [Pelistega sp.]|nr:3-oxoadipate enol-lactonase [Pelistega sp.]